MFSWIDYIENENYQNKISDKNIKILKTSTSCHFMPEKTFSNVKRNKIHNYKVKINASKNDTNKNRSCKIIDLSPEEKEKLAKLIKELGQLQSEKEEISNKLSIERNSFQTKLQNFEQMHNLTVKEKNELQEILRLKEEKLSKLETQLKFNQQSVEPKSVDIADEFLLVQRSISNCHKKQNSKQKYSQCKVFPGPPQSSKSHEIKQELFRSHSSSINNLTESEQHKQLSLEHERLLIEKHYLDIVLKQQQCLNHLKHKIKKLEKKSIREKSNPPAVESQNDHDNSSVQTLSRDCVVPTVLNDIPDDRTMSSESKHESNSKCYSVESIDNYSLIDPPKPIRSIINSASDSMILQDEDLFIITTLNEDRINSEERIHIPTPLNSYNTNLMSLRSHSPTDSLFDIISNLDEMDFEKSHLSHSRNSSLKNLSDQEIIDDLFFNRLFH